MVDTVPKANTHPAFYHPIVKVNVLSSGEGASPDVAASARDLELRDLPAAGVRRSRVHASAAPAVRRALCVDSASVRASNGGYSLKCRWPGIRDSFQVLKVQSRLR
jgi:hypothetical protein